MNEEVSRILKMVEEGKINADKAQELIEAIGKEQNNNSIKVLENDNIMDKMLKIKVNSASGDNVDIKLPIKLIKILLNTLGKLPIKDSTPGMENIDLNVISDAIDEGLVGKIIDVKSANGDIVEVVIE
ncbi:SHOCT-like domain-containing protein [Clostridium felsineum]|uniref:YvlB/LiaX N-terminal domain-containing protein n=1 Tax=Clostridium felsineum TaxID=36839 RepID=A0A1S8LSK5_9CLOT|nr:hypothetical protein [Clostridium felsineum]URZ05200.1 hypothetical protein CLROS_005240 [Clostridium felsineum]URZ10241.1 hypothetical protein CROST_009490 [Clostridium felsineum]